MEHPFEKDGRVFEAYVQNQKPGAYRLFVYVDGPEATVANANFPFFVSAP